MFKRLTNQITSICELLSLKARTAQDPFNTAKMRIEDMSIKEGQDFKIRIKPDDDCSRFSINIGHDSENIALHFNPRFDDSVIVCNSMSGGCWGDEHRDGNLCFSRGEESKFYINFNFEEFFIKLPDGSMMSFPNRLGDGKYKYFEVRGDARIIGMKLK
ncbi:galectin-2-like isoform X2 [Corythoichthys intestinalis]|uniref:galectin-2-like isoform X2 n=1 Tax=Corythoichthys intestinalis TaxID=161448 RepID=UPI0025A646EA|nr:galectin-2-like isoform X2 [Corythoichthys intestinalis]